MTLKRAVFQIHSWLGLSLGLVIASIGLSGALLAFEDEWLLALNPGIVSSAPRAAATLAPPRLLDRAREQLPERRVESIKVWNDGDRSPELSLAPDDQHARETRHLDAHSGALLPKMRGESFFHAVEEWHRWLLLEHGVGKLVTGSLALVLLGLTLGGLYLRWPRPALNWRRWLVIDFKLKGRPFLRSLHLGLGSWALLSYLIFTSTGPYWAFDAYRKTLEQWASIRPTPTDFTTASAVESPLRLDRAWASFARDVPSYGSAIIRLPASSNQPIQIQYLDPNPAHDKARNRYFVIADGQLVSHERYAEQGVAARLVRSNLALHTGSYFGLAGRLFMMLGALTLPMLMISGWLMYLARRRRQRQA